MRVATIGKKKEEKHDGLSIESLRETYQGVIERTALTPNALIVSRDVYNKLLKDVHQTPGGFTSYSGGLTELFGMTVSVLDAYS